MAFIQALIGSGFPLAMALIKAFRIKRFLLILPLLLFCGVGRSAQYSNEIKEVFTKACIGGTPRSIRINAATKYCQCVWVGTSTKIPYEDFLKLDRGEAMSPSSNLIMKDLIAKCGGRANDLQLLN